MSAARRRPDPAEFAPTAGDDGPAIAVPATYYEVDVWEQQGNPWLAAVPVLPHETILDRLASRPRFDSAVRALPEQRRLAALSTIKSVFIPGDRHVRLARSLLTLMRDGYVSRNPLAGVGRPRQGSAAGAAAAQNATTGLLLASDGGMGKSTTMQGVLGLVPERMLHTCFEGIEFQSQQLTHMTLTCPERASVKAFCLAALERIDRRLEVKLGWHATKDRPNQQTLTSRLGSVCRSVGPGVLVVDEAQHLLSGPDTNNAELLKFLIRLQNEIRLPVVLVGNMDVFELVKKELRAGRRATSEGDHVWARFREDEDEFELLLQGLFAYQYVRNPVALDESLRAAFFENSQGIPDLMGKLFRFAQERAIETQGEEITPDVVYSVRDKLRSPGHILDAIRDRDTDTLSKLREKVVLDMRTLTGGPTVATGGSVAAAPSASAADERVGRRAPEMANPIPAQQRQRTRSVRRPTGGANAPAERTATSRARKAPGVETESGGDAPRRTATPHDLSDRVLRPEDVGRL